VKIPRLTNQLPCWKNILLTVLAAGLLIVAFPDFEWWWTAWFALVPLMWAVDRQKHSITASFLLGWLFGVIFFFGTCWWLAYAPIHYAAFPPLLAYSLILIVCLAAGIFPGIFATVLSLLLRRFGSWAFLAAPFVWVACEFARYWITGNNWNAIGYSQAFYTFSWQLHSINVGGAYLIGFDLVAFSSFIAHALTIRQRVKGTSPISLQLRERLVSYTFYTYFNFLLGFVFLIADKQTRGILFGDSKSPIPVRLTLLAPILSGIVLSVFVFGVSKDAPSLPDNLLLRGITTSYLIAVQPNVPMSGLDSGKLARLRARQVELSGTAFDSNLDKYVSAERGGEQGLYRKMFEEKPKLVVFPESPMDFLYNDDREFQKFVRDFTTKNNVSLLFNSSEPDPSNGKYFNSAIMIGPDGNKIAEYDKIFLLPFGEAVPAPFEGFVPGFVGNFSYGDNYALLPVGDAKAGVMICFESHFGQLSREYVRNGADVIIEMTNDGYLGPTPVLRQHLANAVFRAVETNRPVLRVTNVGVTAYITEKGEVLDATQPYQEDTRVWSVSKSDGSQTFYVRYGDWFAWLCTIITLGLLGYAIFWRRDQTV
jgi:apolipoprotein N-acyltransferase